MVAGSTPRRPAAVLFLVTLVTYAYFYQAGGWNQNSRFDLVRSLVERRTAVIDDYHENTGDKALRDEHYYCDKAPGASWLAVPAYALVHALASDPESENVLSVGSYAATVSAVALPSALSVAVLALLLGSMGVSLSASAAVAAAYGLGTLAFPYSTLFYGHQLAAALTLIGFALLVTGRRSGRAPSPRRLFASGLALGWAVAVEYPAALAAVPIAIHAATWVRPWRRLGWLALGGGLLALALMGYHAAAFGGPFTLPYEFSTQPHRSSGFFMGLGVPSGEALAGILFTSYRGLFYSAPWLVLALPGALVWWRRGFRGEVATCSVIALLFVWMNSSLIDWEGGWTIGARYLIGALPFMAVLVAGIAAGPSWPRVLVRTVCWLGAASALYAVFMMLAGTAVKPELPMEVHSPFGEIILPALRAGELALNTQSIDSYDWRGQRAHAWNLGQLVGLRGSWSLAPLLLVWGLGAWWLSRAARAYSSSNNQIENPTRAAGS